MQATLDLGYISVYNANGERLLLVGSDGTDGPVCAQDALGRWQFGLLRLRLVAAL